MGESAEMWCWMNREEADQYLEMNNKSWPFFKVSIKDFYLLAEERINLILKLLGVVDCIGITISACGIFLSPLLLCTLWRKAFQEKNAFFVSMFFIACLDMIFSAVTVAYRTWYPALVLEGSESYIVTWIMVWISSMPTTFSVATDMVALALTMERYIAVAKPHLYTKMTRKMKRAIRLLVIAVVSLLACSKLHYTFVTDIVVVGDIYRIIITNGSRFWVTVGIFGDMILPFALLIITPVVSARFRAAVLKHLKKSTTRKIVQPVGNPKQCWTAANEDKIPSTQPGKSDQAQPELSADKSKEWRSMMTLTLILDAMLILTQLVNCFFCVAELILEKFPVSYESDYNDLWWWWFGECAENVVDILVNIVENSSRAFNIFFYIALSSAVRNEFIAFVMKLRKLILGH